MAPPYKGDQIEITADPEKFAQGKRGKRHSIMIKDKSSRKRDRKERLNRDQQAIQYVAPIKAPANKRLRLAASCETGRGPEDRIVHQQIDQIPHPDKRKSDPALPLPRITSVSL